MALSAKEILEYMGRVGNINIDGWNIPVECIDVKEAYGNLRVKVFCTWQEQTESAKWVDASRVTWEPKND